MTDIFDDLTSISPSVAKLDSLPLLGGPRFPIEALTERLRTVFDFPSLSIAFSSFEWLEKQEILDQIGTTSPVYVFGIPPYKGKLYWSFSTLDQQLLISHLLVKEATAPFLRDEELKKTFTAFLIYEILFQLSQTDFDRTLIPQFLGTEVLPDEDGICLDVTLHLKEDKLKGRLLIDSTLRRAISTAHKDSETPKELEEHIELPFEIEVGRTQLSVREWSQVKLGDFILLDECLIDSETISGSVRLNYQGHKKFSGALNNSQITITDVYED